MALVAIVLGEAGEQFEVTDLCSALKPGESGRAEHVRLADQPDQLHFSTSLTMICFFSNSLRNLRTSRAAMSVLTEYSFSKRLVILSTEARRTRCRQMNCPVPLV